MAGILDDRAQSRERRCHTLITGSSSGIGLATALHFARKGHRVFASLRDPDAAAGLQRAAADGLPLTLVRLDVTDDASVARGVAEVLSQAGHIDVLVNNAGIGGSGPVERASLERARQTFETNYFGAVRMIRAALPGMRDRRSGAIVNVTSIAGRIALPAHSHYAASKFALEALSEGLAAEVRPFGIRVAIVEPGVIPTPILSKRPANLPSPAPYETPVRRLSRYFQKQLVEPTPVEAVAEAIEHAATTDSPRLRYLVGKDAHALMRGRAQLSDEQWIAGHALEGDEDFFDFMKASMGTDLFR